MLLSTLPKVMLRSLVFHDVSLPQGPAERLLLTVAVWCAVQHQCIPSATIGSDVLCQAKSGMGKTAVFVLSILQQIRVETDEATKLAKVGALVMAHTRELAFQVGRLPSACLATWKLLTSTVYNSPRHFCADIQ